jgi:hypothetical protein
MRSPFGCLVGLVSVLAVCMVLFAGVLWLAGGFSAVPGQAATPATGPAVAEAAVPGPTATPDANAASSAKQKLAVAMRTATAAAPGSHQPVSLTLSEAEVNAIAVPEMESDADFPLQQPSIQILPGKVILNGQAPLGPTLLPVSVTGSVDLTDGVPTLAVTSVQASGITAPQGIVRQVSDQVSNSLRLTPDDLPITVQAVTLGNHSMTVTGVTK